MLYLSKLASLLTSENKDWRKNTVLLLDGASYHKSDETRTFFGNLGVKVILSAPYSYASAPIELFFAYFKQTNFNTAYLPVGKK